jgi:molybdopterin converting factor small subunit|tara:strand:+ start:142 stop:459 length:318 start_codon:yes stop_codon:yes gene_type:complete
VEQIMSKVRLEVLSWLAETLDIEEKSGTVSLEQEIEEGKAVWDLLNRLATRYQRFGQIVFDTNAQKLTGRAVIFFNGRTLELVNGLETKLSDGDTLTFVPIIEGG